ncbi:hypothetical protein LOCC1_G006390 [Lachnellula occidentalis]|uniref:Zn(2)-C6 fungal-type domain-containing protein n=1 Tax=Lachnellula occidentalis TaxID=215460 RepID=A0A8H8UBU3_9HELO|nr:hypothetical protein LOCC1_G006390 [Lachnellula occidentalis]
MSTLPPRSDKEIRQILHKRTKRARTSCYPCRTRKVKCDKGLPCENCSKRGYPELCSFTSHNEVSKDAAATYNHPATQGAGHQSAEHLAQQPSPEQWIHEAANSSNDIISESQDRRIPSLLRDSRADAVSVSSGASRLDARSNISTSAQQDCSDFRFAADDGEPGQRESFLGSNSMPAFLRNQSSQDGSIHNSPIQPVEDAILPILGLKGPKSTYPFLPDPETSTGRTNSELYQALPADHEIIRLFEHYKLNAQSFTPIIPDMEDYEAGLCQYLEERALLKRQSYNQNPGAQTPEHSRPISWVASVFAILASGAHYSHSPSHERQAKSRLYARYSFQCLRLANFMVRPSLSCIKTLLVLGTVLQNDTKPEAAWIMLGTTARMAQSLGLHEKQKDSPSPRTKLWEALVWQDSLLSLCFDRPPVTTPSISDKELVGELRYQDAMNLLCDRTLRSVRDKANTPNFVAILENVYRIEEIYQNSIANTANQSRLSISKRSEMFALRLHISFVIAWICRPALANSRSPEQRTETQLILIEKCHANLLGCIRAFVRLHSIKTLAFRSWPVIHNGLSSALLLGLLGATNTNFEVRQLQGEILDILSAESDYDSGQKQGVGANIELSAPHARALAVLRRLYNNRAADPAPHGALDGEIPIQEDQFQPTSNTANAFLYVLARYTYEK